MVGTHPPSGGDQPESQELRSSATWLSGFSRRGATRRVSPLSSTLTLVRTKENTGEPWRSYMPNRL